MWKLIIAFLNFAVAAMYFVLAVVDNGAYAIAAVLWLFAGTVWVWNYSISER